MWKNLSSVMEGEIVRLEPLTRRHEEGLFDGRTRREGLALDALRS